MAGILNITNGDCAVDIMRRAGIEGQFLPWRDVLHEGPVVYAESLVLCSDVRAKYIVSQGWGDIDSIRADFASRDKLIESSDSFDNVVLWFEHDLYDQLQILQILHWYHHHPLKQAALSMICTSQFLGWLTPEQMKEMTQHEKAVSPVQLSLAAQAWEAFCQPTPEMWAALLNQDLSALPFLSNAITRMLQELPSVNNGLSLTAQHILMSVDEGEQLAGDVFRRCTEREESEFMGDSSFWHIINGLISAKPALLAVDKGETLKPAPNKYQSLSLTKLGQDVLAGKEDAVIPSALDRWVGGTHLTLSSLWRWNDLSKTLHVDSMA